MKRKTPFIILLLSLCAAGIAQPETEVKKNLELLKYFQGTWSVNVEARLSAQGPWDTSVARSVIKFTTGSKLLEEDLTGTREKKPFLSKTIFAVNNINGVFQRIFADSEHGALIDFEGMRNEQSFVFDKLWAYPNKSTVKLRIVYTIVSTNEFKVESMRMPEGTTNWDVTGRMRYKRLR